MTEDPCIVRLPRVQALTGGWSASTIYRLERAGRFPKRVQLGPNSVGWRLAEINAWIESRRPPAEHESDRGIAAKGGSK